MTRRFMQIPRGSAACERRWTVTHLAAFVAILVTGCGGVREQFLGTRIQDTCSGEWSVCSTTVGCILGDRSYIEGRFPGTNKVALKLFEPSEVTVSFLLSETTGAGEQTVINFYETSCSSRVRTPVPGRTFIGEAEKAGFVQRKTELSTVGDHLIEVESDARTKYVLKLDVLPLRLRELPSGG
jgi:hypothetical protein